MKVFSRVAEIESGASKSAAVNLGAEYNVGIYQVLGVKMSDTWTEASLAFEVSHDGASFSPLFWNGGVYVVDEGSGAVSGAAVSLEPAAFAGWPYVKVISVDEDFESVPQAGKRELQLMLGSI